jgi:two-component system chemotaxis response regulator CheY
LLYCPYKFGYLDVQTRAPRAGGVGKDNPVKLLIVDDSSIIRKAITRYLKEYGLELVGEAGDGVQALEQMRLHRPDLVTLDITMPEMDGLTCLDEMLKIDPDIKVIVISALSDQATALKALKSGAKGFLGKPFTEEKIKSAFDRVLKGGS